jgi:hypothetical protein
MPSTALVRIGEVLPAIVKPFTSLSDASKMLAEIRDRDLAFLLTPLINIPEIKPFHQVVFPQVYIDPTVTHEKGRDGKTFWKAGPHCYRASFCKDDEVALSKNGLMAILAAAGDDVVTSRMDDRSDPLYAEFAAIIYHKDFDGTTRQYPGHRAVDLRKGSPESTKPGAENAKQFVAQNAETKAILRALRPLYGLSQTYKIADLQRKPFVHARLVAHWDLNDPDQKKAAIFQALGTGAKLFGALPGTEPTPPAEGTPPPPVKETAKTTPPEGTEEAMTAEIIEDTDDLPDFDEPSIVVCGCPCGHQLEVTPEVAELTKASTGGAVRCATCYPGRSFDYNAHKDLRDLGIPKHPGLTAARVRDKWAAKDAEEKKK